MSFIQKLRRILYSSNRVNGEQLTSQQVYDQKCKCWYPQAKTFFFLFVLSKVRKKRREVSLSVPEPLRGQIAVVTVMLYGLSDKRVDLWFISV